MSQSYLEQYRQKTALDNSQKMQSNLREENSSQSADFDDFHTVSKRVKKLRYRKLVKDSKASHQSRSKSTRITGRKDLFDRLNREFGGEDDVSGYSESRTVSRKSKHFHI